jgi:hypothetical protein
MRKSLLKVGLGLGVVLTFINLGWLYFFIHQHFSSDAQQDAMWVFVVNIVRTGMCFTLFGIMVGLSMAEVIVRVFEKYEGLKSERSTGA